MACGVSPEPHKIYMNLDLAIRGRQLGQTAFSDPASAHLTISRLCGDSLLSSFQQYPWSISTKKHKIPSSWKHCKHSNIVNAPPIFVDPPNPPVRATMPKPSRPLQPTNTPASLALLPGRHPFDSMPAASPDPRRPVTISCDGGEADARET